MVSDCIPGVGEPLAPGNNVSVTLHYTDPAKMAAQFDALASSGGKVTMPLGDTFWDAKFGMLVDAFGVHWMFNHDKKQRA
jgi:PhnB protein